MTQIIVALIYTAGTVCSIALLTGLANDLVTARYNYKQTRLPDRLSTLSLTEIEELIQKKELTIAELREVTQIHARMIDGAMMANMMNPNG